MKLLWALPFFSSALLFGGSVRLLNDSPYILRAVVRGNDGTELGEAVVNPGQGSTWYDTIGYLGYGELNQNNTSETPYTVLWHCMDGNDYSICYQVANAGTVTAQSCDGARQCKAVKKQPQQQPSDGQ